MAPDSSDDEPCLKKIKHVEVDATTPPRRPRSDSTRKSKADPFESLKKIVKEDKEWEDIMSAKPLDHSWHGVSRAAKAKLNRIDGKEGGESGRGRGQGRGRGRGQGRGGVGGKSKGQTEGLAQSNRGKTGGRGQAKVRGRGACEVEVPTWETDDDADHEGVEDEEEEDGEDEGEEEEEGGEDEEEPEEEEEHESKPEKAKGLVMTEKCVSSRAYHREYRAQLKRGANPDDAKVWCLKF